jgi:hypothetical protein
MAQPIHTRWPTWPFLYHGYIEETGELVGAAAPLQSRPAGGASQSAAEAALGLVTVDILGLAGTGVPPAEPPGLWRKYTIGINTDSTYMRETMIAGDFFILVGAIAAPTATVVSADWVLVSTGAVTPMNGTSGGHWWWYQFTDRPGNEEMDFRVWLSGGGQTIHYDLLRLDGRHQVYPPGTGGSGEGTHAVCAPPSGGYWVFDHGGNWNSYIDMTADAGQIVDYAHINQVNNAHCASHRNEPGPMGWTSASSMSWHLHAIGAALAP